MKQPNPLPAKDYQRPAPPPAPPDDMALPAGRTCADCISYARCVALLSARHVNDKQTRCDWAPSRFRLDGVKIERRLNALLAALHEQFEAEDALTAWEQRPAADYLESQYRAAEHRVQIARQQVRLLVAQAGA